MTDARLKGEWLTATAHDGLSDPAYRVLHNALMYCAEQGTDGTIARRALRYLYPGTLELAWIDELEQAGFWEATDDGYQLLGWDTALGQSTAADVEHYRLKARERKRRQREREQGAAGQPPEDENTPPGGDSAATPVRAHTGNLSRGDTRRDVTRDRTANVGKDRPGPEGPVLASRKTRVRAHDCARDGHRMDAAGITCLKCEFRDIERQHRESIFGAV